MFTLPFILLVSVSTLFNVYMWYWELTNLKIRQFVTDMGGTIIIVILFSSTGATVTGFAIAMIVSGIWSLIAIIKEKKYAKLKQQKLAEKMTKKYK